MTLATDKVSTVAHGKSTVTTPEPTPHGGNQEAMATRIAVIDDDPVFLNLLHDLLIPQGYDAHVFAQGTAAYRAIRTLHPDGIILDIRMGHPEEGWQLLDLFRLDPALRHTPVIICTADSHMLQERGMHLQSNECDLLAKPFDIDDLLSVLYRVVGAPSETPVSAGGSSGSA
jgi:CheY-like chemotaxis protein